jgi:hypothetical protein
MKLPKFRLLGLRNASLGILWARLAFNVTIWIRATQQRISAPHAAA